jgi:uncharacterized protein YkwD
MSKKAFSIILLAGIVLSACGGQATQTTETPTALPTETAAPHATDTPTQAEIPVTGDTQEASTLTPTPTATAFVPENATDCVNMASFVTDVSIPDNTTITAGSPFTKTWRVRNTGTCIWWSGYKLTHYSENAMSAPASVPLPITNPGETADISVDLVAPSAAGTYRGNFVIENPAGLIMQVDEDSRLWLIINVVGAPTGAATAPADTPNPGNGSPTATTSSSESTSANVSCALITDVPRTEQVAAAINAYRSQNSLVAYTVNTQLAQAAQRHANDMACNNYCLKTNTDLHIGSDGSKPDARVADAGYTATSVTENVNCNYPPLAPEQAVTWWKFDQNDLNHNKNLISTDYAEIGVGYALFNNYGYYVVDFASP